MAAVPEEYLRRPRIVGLAAKLLVALGLGIGLCLLGGHAAHAADGPLGELTHRASGTVREVTNHVVDVSAPSDAERTVRVLPHGDAEVATVALHPRHVEVTAPALPAPVTPIRVEVPALAPSLPSIDVATATGPTVPRVTTAATRAAGPATPVAPRAPATMHVAPKAPIHHAHHRAAPGTPPADPPVDRPAGDVPAGAASASGVAVAVLATLGHTTPALDALPLATADRRVPIAPSFEPSFTPD
jgi:hypothetical protein